MAKSEHPSVDAYIAAQPEAVRPILETVRAAIRSALPQAQEVISYQIPAYRVDGRLALFFAGWKKHVSLYPASDGLLAEFRDELAPYRIEKATIRFPLSEPIPADLVGRIARFRADEAVARVRVRGGEAG